MLEQARADESLHSLQGMLACLQAKVDADRLVCDRSILTSRRHRYCALQLVYAFWSAQFLKNDATLRAACMWGLRLPLPRPVAEEWIEKLFSETAPTALPSKSTLSRLRGRIDVAWMITFRQQLKQLLDEGCASYLLWDASPQGGSDYEMFIWEFISNKHLFEVQVNVEDLESRHFFCFHISHSVNTYTNSKGEIGTSKLAWRIGRLKLPS